MSQNDKTAYDEVPGEPPTDSVYDILYHDAKRVGLFLSQLDPSGHLTGLKQTESAETGSGMKFGASVGGSVIVARGGAALEDQTTAGQRETLERTYDPLWANALTLLDFLDERKMIRRDLHKSRIGQIVLVSGSLAMFDLSMVKACWEIPSIRALMMSGAEATLPAAPLLPRKQRREAERFPKTAAPAQANPMTMAFDLLMHLPHAILASIRQYDDIVWSTLREENLVVAASDLVLKHGVNVSGVWNMLGILDAMPSNETEMEKTALSLTAASGLLGAMGALVGSLGPAIRVTLGRPPEAYGMTPLLIFRNVSG
jgi:hypothetical protein